MTFFNSLSRVLEFLEYRSFVFLSRFIPMYYSLFVCNGKWDYFFDSLSDFSLLVHRNATYLFFIRVEKEKK